MNLNCNPFHLIRERGSRQSNAILETLAQESYDMITLLPTYIENTRSNEVKSGVTNYILKKTGEIYPCEKVKMISRTQMEKNPRSKIKKSGHLGKKPDSTIHKVGLLLIKNDVTNNKVGSLWKQTGVILLIFSFENRAIFEIYKNPFKLVAKAGQSQMIICFTGIMWLKDLNYL